MVNPRLLKVEKWFGTKKEIAAVRTVCSHIENMLKGVTLVRKTICTCHKILNAMVACALIIARIKYFISHINSKIVRNKVENLILFVK